MTSSRSSNAAGEDQRSYLILSATPIDDVGAEDFANLVRDLSLLADVVTIALTSGFNAKQFNKTMSFRHGPRPPRERRLRLEVVSQRSPLLFVGSVGGLDQMTLLIAHDLITLGLPVADAFLRRLGERLADLIPLPHRGKPMAHGDEPATRPPEVSPQGITTQELDYEAVVRELRQSKGGRMMERITQRIVYAPGYTDMETRVEREFHVNGPNGDSSLTPPTDGQPS